MTQGGYKEPFSEERPGIRRPGFENKDGGYNLIGCRVQRTIVNGPDARPTQLIPTDEGFIDYFGRPWADNWEKHFEQGWKKPEDGK